MGEATKSATCKVADLRAHYKNTYNVARAVKGMMIKKAIHYMENVLEHKQIIPFRRYYAQRHAQCKEFKAIGGRWPEKSVKAVRELLINVKSNCHVEFHVTEKKGQVAKADKPALKMTKKQAARTRLAVG